MKMGPGTGIGLGIGTGYAPAKEKPFLLILSLTHLTQILLSISSSSNDGLFFLRKKWYCWIKDSMHVWHRVPDGLPKHYRVHRDTTNGTGMIWYLQHCTLSSIASFSLCKQPRISSEDPRPLDHHLRNVPTEKHDPVRFILTRDIPYTLDTWRGSSWFFFFLVLGIKHGPKLSPWVTCQSWVGCLSKFQWVKSSPKRPSSMHTGLLGGIGLKQQTRLLKSKEGNNLWRCSGRLVGGREAGGLTSPQQRDFCLQIPVYVRGR